MRFEALDTASPQQASAVKRRETMNLNLQYLSSFPPPVITTANSGLITSGLMEDDKFVEIHESEDNVTPAANVMSTLLVISVALVFFYHMFLAWRLLPGAVLVSGGVTPNPEETAPAATGNRFAQYLAITLLTAVYVALYGAFAFRRGDAWEYHYILLAWVMSLIASFDDFISVVWLGITTGAFIQGVGAYSFGFLFHTN